MNYGDKLFQIELNKKEESKKEESKKVSKLKYSLFDIKVDPSEYESVDEEEALNNLFIRNKIKILRDMLSDALGVEKAKTICNCFVDFKAQTDSFVYMDCFIDRLFINLIQAETEESLTENILDRTIEIFTKIIE